MSKLIVTQTWTGDGLVNYPIEGGGQLQSKVTAFCFEANKPGTDYIFSFTGQLPPDQELEFAGKASCVLRHETAESSSETETNCLAGVGTNIPETGETQCDFVTKVQDNMHEVPTLSGTGILIMIAMISVAAISAFKIMGR